MSAPAFLQIRHIVKDFDGHRAVDDVSIDIAKGEVFALLGSSGCGKTTLLRMLAGFETPTSGTITLDGHDLAGLPPYERPMNMMFQSYALFPHLSVFDNIAFGLRRDRLPAPEIAARVEAMLKLVQLGGYAKRKPHQLSGGQQQRVALARSLAKQAAIAAARRAARRPRPEAPRGDADRARQHHPRGRRHLRHGHARPGRSDDDGFAHRGDERRPLPAGRRPGRDLRDAVEPLRRRLHRQRQPDGRDCGRGRGRPRRRRLRRLQALDRPRHHRHARHEGDAWRCGRRRSASIAKRRPTATTNRRRPSIGPTARSRNSPTSAASRSITCSSTSGRILKVSQSNTERQTGGALTWDDAAWASWAPLSPVVLTQ